MRDSEWSDGVVRGRHRSKAIVAPAGVGLRRIDADGGTSSRYSRISPEEDRDGASPCDSRRSGSSSAKQLETLARAAFCLFVGGLVGLASLSSGQDPDATPIVVMLAAAGAGTALKLVLPRSGL